MKSDFLLAITQLSAEKNLPPEIVLKAVETALVSAYRKDSFTITQNVSVKIEPNTGRVQVWAEKEVVEQPADSRCQISLEEAQQIKADAQLGDILNIEATPHNAGRIAAQTAKQVILQRLHEAEHSAIFEEYVDREGDIITGLVQRIEPKQIIVDLGRTEAILPAAEQVRNERYRVGQRLKVYLLEVAQTDKGPRIFLSRSHPNLIRRLFELEVPEVLNGIVEIKAIAREAGHRSKIAVAASQEGIDPVGCCVGLRGIRIQNIVNELGGEKLDVTMWSPDAAKFITSGLSPAQVLNVRLDEANGIATVVVPDKQLSLAIGKEGQNARLAARLTGWRIDIKSASSIEAERIAEAKPAAEEAEPSAEIAGEVIISEELPPEIPAIEEPAPEPAETAPEEAAEPMPALDSGAILQEVAFIEPAAEIKPQLRFAEELMAGGPGKSVAKPKKKKKSTRSREGTEGSARPSKARRTTEFTVDDEEY
ncbi:transcription termination factor NusA [Chloroflexota bacterium]